MVCRRSGGRLELLRFGVSWNARRLARMTRVGRPVPDVAGPTAKVFRIGANPGAWIDRDRNGSQAELRHSAWAPVSAPGSALGLLLSRALSSAQAVLQSEAVVPFTQPLAPSHRPTARLSCAPRNGRSRSARIRAPRPATLSAGVTYPSAPRTRQSPSMPFRSHLSLSGERERPFRPINRAAAIPWPFGSTGQRALATRAPRPDAHS
jgi:hypothetical protein